MKKLRPGDLQGKRLRIVLRDLPVDRDTIEAGPPTQIPAIGTNRLHKRQA
ncbi:MAG: hypothetical protein K2Q97_17380 [Burkholderiaceae bacterium]|nr:hypothetical protein [Burkholderiaceae bacterium]